MLHLSVKMGMIIIILYLNKFTVLRQNKYVITLIFINKNYCTNSLMGELVMGLDEHVQLNGSDVQQWPLLWVSLTFKSPGSLSVPCCPPVLLPLPGRF